MHGLSDMKALLMLVLAELIVNKLQQDAQEMMLSRQELVDILKIYLLNASPQTEQHKNVLALATSESNIREAITFTVYNWIEFQIERMDQEQEPGRSR